jgi:hypothetical protein
MTDPDEVLQPDTRLKRRLLKQARTWAKNPNGIRFSTSAFRVEGTITVRHPSGVPADLRLHGALREFGMDNIKLKKENTGPISRRRAARLRNLK